MIKTSDESVRLLRKSAASKCTSQHVVTLRVSFPFKMDFIRVMFVLLSLCCVKRIHGQDDSVNKIRSRPVMTEAEKQTAFLQLLTGRSRLNSGSVGANVINVQEEEKEEEVEEKGHERRHRHTSSVTSLLDQDQEPAKKIKGDKNKSKKNQDKKPQRQPGRHVCTHEEIVTRPVKVVESYCKPAYKSFTQRCSNGTNLCTAFRVQYDTVYRTVVKYQAVTEKKQVCCPGWTYQTPHKNSHNCLQAVCSQGCKNGGSCVKPDICMCAPGYTGPSCENDLNECSSGTHRCQHSCVNAVGNYQCACHEGFELLEDGRSCKLRLESIPEFQALLANYEAISKRMANLEEESRNRNQQSPLSSRLPSTPSPEVIDVVRFESTIANMTEHILMIEDRLLKLNETTALMLSNSSNSGSGYNDSQNENDYSLVSLSEQIGMLEERLADCSCTPSSSTRAKPRF